MGQMTRFAGLETTALKLGGRRKRSLERTCRLVAFVPLSDSCTAGPATCRRSAPRAWENSDGHPGQSIIP